MTYPEPLLALDLSADRFAATANSHDEPPATGTATGQVERLMQPTTIAAAGKINVQFGGDSNFAGAGVSNHSTDTLMAFAKAQLDPNKWQTDNIYQYPFQQGGRTTQDWVQMMHVDEFTSYHNTPNVRNPSWVKYAYQPGKKNILVLMLGTNDVGRDASYSPFFNGNGTASYAGVRANFTRILKELVAIGWVPIVLIPMDLGPNYPNYQILRHWMLTHVRALGGHLYDVSTDPVIGLNPLNGSVYWNDALHLSTKGMTRLWTQIVRPALLANA